MKMDEQLKEQIKSLLMESLIIEIDRFDRYYIEISIKLGNSIISKCQHNVPAYEISQYGKDD